MSRAYVGHRRRTAKMRPTVTRTATTRMTHTAMPTPTSISGAPNMVLDDKLSSPAGGAVVVMLGFDLAVAEFLSVDLGFGGGCELSVFGCVLAVARLVVGS